jgi:CDP-diacylglycerol--glycerol-3-phosphate 3-phosphatidyltransferase
MGLYRLKPASQRLVRPLEDLAVARGLTPDALTLLALPVSLFGGLALASWLAFPLGLLAVPLLAGTRLVLNLLDGLVARRTGSARPLGEVWNELGDRACDVLFIGGLALAPGVDPRLGAAAVIGALLASYSGLAAKAAGGTRQYGGIMSKPGRMSVLAIAAPLTWATTDPVWLTVAAAAVAIGALLTLLQRIRATAAELGRAG